MHCVEIALASPNAFYMVVELGECNVNYSGKNIR